MMITTTKIKFSWRDTYVGFCQYNEEEEENAGDDMHTARTRGAETFINHRAMSHRQTIMISFTAKQLVHAPEDLTLPTFWSSRQ